MWIISAPSLENSLPAYSTVCCLLIVDLPLLAMIINIILVHFLGIIFFLFRYVYIAMEAMDHLLLACRSSSLNLFVESFLKMVSTLLENNEVGLHICAANSVSETLVFIIMLLSSLVAQKANIKFSITQKIQLLKKQTSIVGSRN